MFLLPDRKWRTDQGTKGVFDADIVDQARRVIPCGNGYAIEEDNS